MLKQLVCLLFQGNYYIDDVERQLERIGEIGMWRSCTKCGRTWWVVADIA